MTTIGWVLILTAALVVRGVTKGRSITDIPGDLGDMFIALVEFDPKALQAAASRTGETNTVAAVANSPAVEVSASAAGHSADQKALIAFGKQLQAQGYKVSENPAFGGVTKGVHVENSKHYSGDAIDVNCDGCKGGEKAALDKANAAAKSYGFKTLWQVAGHFDHLHVEV